MDHAYNKLNTATIPAQTPIPRKDVLLNSMGKSTIFSALDLKDDYVVKSIKKNVIDNIESDYDVDHLHGGSHILWIILGYCMGAIKIYR